MLHSPAHSPPRHAPVQHSPVHFSAKHAPVLHSPVHEAKMRHSHSPLRFSPVRHSAAHKADPAVHERNHSACHSPVRTHAWDEPHSPCRSPPNQKAHHRRFSVHKSPVARQRLRVDQDPWSAFVEFENLNAFKKVSTGSFVTAMHRALQNEEGLSLESLVEASSDSRLKLDALVSNLRNRKSVLSKCL